MNEWTNEQRELVRASGGDPFDPRFLRRESPVQRGTVTEVEPGLSTLSTTPSLLAGSRLRVSVCFLVPVGEQRAHTGCLCGVGEVALKASRVAPPPSGPGMELAGR